MQRTPVIGTLPKVLRRNIKPERTPVIDGIPVRKVADLNLASDADIAAAIQMAGVSPESDPAWSDAQHRLLQHSCAYFCSEVVRGPKGPPYNGRFILGPHHMEWDQLVMDHNRLNILAARDHGKSFFFTIGFSIWKAGFNDLGSEGVIFSATQPQAEAFLGKIKDELRANPKLAHLIPYTGDRFWSAKKIVLRNGSVIRAAGFGVKVRGGHPDWCICDDILNDDDIYSETIRRRNIDYFLSAISGMVHRRKQLIVVGTPMHHGDLYADLAETGEYKCCQYPARDPVTGVPLWPDRYSEEDLQAKRRELKSEARFAREFLCQPLSDEASLFPSKLFEGPSVRLPYVLGLPGSYWEERGMVRYTGVDIAMSAETGGDYFVIFTVAVDAKGTRYVANIRRHKGLSFRAQLDEIKEEYYLMKPDMIHIEANQMQRVWTDELVETSDIPVRKFFTSGIGGRQPINAWKRGATSVVVNKHHLDRGVPALRMLFEHGKWRIPRGDERSIEETDVWMGEMQAIGWIDGQVQSVGAHDDTVMSCWMCDSAVRLGGFGDYDFGEDTPEDEAADVLPPEAGLPDDGATVDYLEAERRVMAACEEERAVECPRGAYLARARGAMRAFADQCMDQGDVGHARFVLQEIQRLDNIHQFKAYDPEAQSVVKQPSAEYRGWAPKDKSPSVDDLGMI